MLGDEKLSLANASVTAKNANGEEIAFADITKNTGTYTVTIDYSGFDGEGSENYQGSGTIASEVTVYKHSSGGSGGGGGTSTVYTVKFDTDGGDEIASQTVKVNGTTSEPETPEKEGYIFLGWSEVNDGEVVDVSLIEITYSRNFYAKFEAKPQEKKYYTVTFVSDGKTLSSAQYEEGKKFSIPSDPQKADHEFLGWSKTSGGSVVEIETIAKENVTYYAVFKEIKKYTVTFYVDGKTYKTSTVVENGSVHIYNSAVYAMKILQTQMAGEAENAGLTSEEDILSLVNEVRAESEN